MADPNNAYGQSTTTELSISEETKYRKKCRDLKRRINEVEASNEGLVTKLARTKRFIRRARLERAFLLERLEAQAPKDSQGSDGSPTPPASPSLESYSLDAMQGTFDNAQSPDPLRRSGSPGDSGHHTPTHDYSIPSAISNAASAHIANQKERKGSPAPGANNSTKKIKPPKDPNAPKRPKNAFLLFCEIERDSVRAAADPGTGETVDIARELGRVWAEMNDDARKPYRDMYEEDKVRYEKEMSTYEKPKNLATPIKPEDHTEKVEPEIQTPSNPSPRPKVGGFTAVNRA
ncbi:HMG box-containing protein [Taphrina deformans PYCC 5710]|uniref:HMG box-containing protein n=1 Tax=Taphrina deformans (strain PYCC 5710 / ATCC 11124 / CBS 356.35 / IMI 108563 / JCM 9778 / NBRC 8474) TaxID=1097556 RepID=R4X7J0_TAPDE|nr:HMG box-containing protein [Taphrina deformans PYCC 5710]|eukprot:CCG81381.1 HMG box-containing protein [Taphrina deformans PYCC 5710]